MLFLRFAAAFENILEEALGKNPQKGHDLSEEILCEVTLVDAGLFGASTTA